MASKVFSKLFDRSQQSLLQLHKLKCCVDLSYPRLCSTQRGHENCLSLHIRDLDGYDFGRSSIDVLRVSSSGGLPIIHHYDYVSNLPPKHCFAMRKFHGVLRYLKRDQVISMKQVHSPDEVCPETAALHSAKNFPFEKQRSDLDIALEDSLGDTEYLSILQDHLPSLLQSFRPDLVIYDAGVDPHEKDELGKLNLTDQGLFDRDYFVLNECIRRGVPCATVIGGGYSRDLKALSLRHTIVHRAATKLWNSAIL